MSSGKTSAEIEKMLEQGQLTEEYIMPMVMAMGKLAEANGAYTKALTKLGTVENRLKASGSLFSARIGEAGFTGGLVSLYETLMKAMEENGMTADELGKIYGRLFKGLAALVKALTPVVESFIRAVGTLTDMLAWLSKNELPATVLALGLITKAFVVASAAAGGFGAAIMAALARPMAMIAALVVVLDEVRGYFDENVHGLFDDQSLSPEDQKRVHAQRRVMMGGGSAADRALLAEKGYKAEGGFAGGIQKLNQLGGGVNPATGTQANWFDRLRILIPSLNSPFAGTATGIKEWATRVPMEANKGSASVTINVYESGDTEKTRKVVGEEINKVYNISRLGVL